MAGRIAVLMTEGFGSPGGVQLLNRNLARALVLRRECAADFFCLLDTDPDRRYIEDRPFLGFGGHRARFSAAVARALLSRRYDLLLVTHINLAPLAMLWSTAVRRPYVFYAHGIEVWGRLAPARRRLLQRASAILTGSQFSRRRLCDAHGLEEERVHVIPLCLDCFWPASPVQPGSREGSPVLLTVARALKSERYKGHDRVIRSLPRVAAACPAVRYVVVGEGDDYDWLKALAREAGVSDRVELAGPQPAGDLHEFYRRSTVFVMPSRSEGFGLVYLEAMHYRKPCVASDCDAGREIVRHGINGFTVDPADPGLLAETILRLLRDPELCASMGEAGYRLLQSEYTFPRFADAVDAVLSGCGKPVIHHA